MASLPVVVAISFTQAEIDVIQRWRERYLSVDMPDTLEGAVRDILRRISDDMSEMEQ